MHNLLWIASFALPAIGIYCCISRLSNADMEQAALLPFADDPAAAEEMSQATGRFCDEVVAPVAEYIPRRGGDYLDA